jgi:type I restriction enzyme M protein
MISSKYAQAGDILFARVGKRVLGKVAFLKSGKIEISDCIYAIRAPEQYQTKLYQYLKSDIVQEYLKTISAGVCSRFIAKEELLKLPIKLQD